MGVAKRKKESTPDPASQRDDVETRLSALESRVSTLEDINAIRKLHWSYGYYIDFNRADDVVQLFAKDGAVVFLSGEYHGHAGVKRLYGTWFQNFFTQGVNGPVDGMILDHFQMQDIITVSDDRKTAKARFRAILAGGNHVSRPYKPEGLPLQFWEAGVYENDYVREDGVWKIKRLDYMVQWQADWDKGLAYTDAHLKPATVCYPENPLGPDVLLPEDKVRPTWPQRVDVPMHFAHPVLGKAAMAS